ncbi:MAG TPA: lipid II flippase MurJ, partial [Usitatibacteraceae bacterium]|nr:lipid II flippase MurJ [Usitatibacteraceae bacterium]
LGACINAGALFWLLKRAGVYRPSRGWGVFAMQLLIALYLMGGVLWWTVGSESAWLTMPLGERIGRLAFVILAGSFTYFLALWAMGLRPWQFAKRSA